MVLATSKRNLAIFALDWLGTNWAVHSIALTLARLLQCLNFRVKFAQESSVASTDGSIWENARLFLEESALLAPGWSRTLYGYLWSVGRLLCFFIFGFWPVLPWTVSWLLFLDVEGRVCSACLLRWLFSYQGRLSLIRWKKLLLPGSVSRSILSS